MVSDALMYDFSPMSLTKPGFSVLDLSLLTFRRTRIFIYVENDVITLLLSTSPSSRFMGALDGI